MTCLYILRQLAIGKYALLLPCLLPRGVKSSALRCQDCDSIHCCAKIILGQGHHAVTLGLSLPLFLSGGWSAMLPLHGDEETNDGGFMWK